MEKFLAVAERAGYVFVVTSPNVTEIPWAMCSQPVPVYQIGDKRYALTQVGWSTYFPLENVAGGERRFSCTTNSFLSPANWRKPAST